MVHPHLYVVRSADGAHSNGGCGSGLAVAELNPVKHFVFVMRSVLVRGAGMGGSILGLAAGGVLVLSLAVLRYRKSTA